MTEGDSLLHVSGAAMLQCFSIKAGLNRYGEAGKKACSKGLQQLQDMDTYEPMDPDKLTRLEKTEALTSLVFLVENRNGLIKARAVADGSKQGKKESYKNQDATSPTVSNESTMVTSTISAHEGRDNMTIDLPGALLHALCKQHIIMLLRADLAEMMILIQPELCRKHIRYDSKGKAILYLKMNKVIYGMLESALAFYKKLRKDVEDYCFKVNPYDPCVANKTTNGSQHTVIWHADDLQASHMDPMKNTKLALYLSGIYGNDLSIHGGKIYDYLGMQLDYSEKGSLVVAIIKYLHKVIKEFPERITRYAATPAADLLFQVQEDGKTKLREEKRAQQFHTTVAQLLLLSSRAR